MLPQFLTLVVAAALVALGAWAAIGGAVLAVFASLDPIAAPVPAVADARLCRAAGAAGFVLGVALFTAGVWIGTGMRP